MKKSKTRTMAHEIVMGWQLPSGAITFDPLVVHEFNIFNQKKGSPRPKNITVRLVPQEDYDLLCYAWEACAK